MACIPSSPAHVKCKLSITCMGSVRLPPTLIKGSAPPSGERPYSVVPSFPNWLNVPHWTSASTLLNAECLNNLAGETDAPTLFYSWLASLAVLTFGIVDSVALAQAP
jgi:hypothetical protein